VRTWAAEGAGRTFVMVRPAMLTEGMSAKVRVFGDDGKGVAWMPKISRSTVAGFMVDAADEDTYDGRSPVITN
jgi:hypothetical protein